MEAITARQIARSFSRTRFCYDNAAFAQQYICDHLSQLLPSPVKKEGYQRILEIGCGTGGFTRYLKDLCPMANEWVLNDLSADFESIVAPLFSKKKNFHFVVGDAERCHFKGQFDLIASASALQWMADPKQFLDKISGLLRAEGILLLSTFAPGNLFEIKSLTGNGLTYPTRETFCHWISKELEILHAEEGEIVLPFRSPLEVLKHLKETGVNGGFSSSTGCWTRNKLAVFCQEYTERFSIDTEHVSLTYRPIYILAKNSK